jgi:hypothetical protein
MRPLLYSNSEHFWPGRSQHWIHRHKENRTILKFGRGIGQHLKIDHCMVKPTTKVVGIHANTNHTAIWAQHQNHVLGKISHNILWDVRRPPSNISQTPKRQISRPSSTRILNGCRGEMPSHHYAKFCISPLILICCTLQYRVIGVKISIYLFYTTQENIVHPLYRIEHLHTTFLCSAQQPSPC